MCISKIKEVLELIQLVFTICAIIVGGVWVLFLYKRQRENKPHIEFTTDVTFHKKIGAWWIVELIAYVENKGKVVHKFDNFIFELNSINSQDQIDISDTYGGQVFFPNLLAKGSFLPAHLSYFFIEPGVKGKYSYLTRVPDNAEIILFHAKFIYQNPQNSHTAEKTLLVPKQ